MKTVWSLGQQECLASHGPTLLSTHQLHFGVPVEHKTAIINILMILPGDQNS